MNSSYPVLLQHAAVDFQSVGEHALGRELGEVFENLHLVRPVTQQQSEVLLFLRGAEDEADRLVLTLAPVVLLEPREIQIHRTFVSSDEWPDLQINGHEAARACLARRPKRFRAGLYGYILSGEESEANAARQARSKSHGGSGAKDAYHGDEQQRPP